MFQKNAKHLMKVAVIVMAISLVTTMTVSAAQRGDARDTGSAYVNTDGSTTVFPIIEVASYQFPAAFPGEHLNYDNGNGTGSGHGRVSLLSQVPIASGNGGPNDPIDVALASSGCSAGLAKDEHGVTVANFTEGAEPSNGLASALTCAQLTDVQIAKDAITILVSQAKAACITTAAHPFITSNEIVAIWSGLTYNGESSAPSGTGGTVQHAWNEFWPGCGGENIVPVSRIALPASSGTRSAFLDFTHITHDSGNEELEVAATGKPRFQANADVEHDISTNPSDMGYTGIAFDNTLTAQLPLGLSPATSGVLPNYANVANSSYGYSRPLHFYYKTGQSKQAVLDLATFLLSAAGQGNIKKQGFVAVADASNPAIPGGSAPAPDWDVNADHTGNILDVTSIGAYFGQTGPASGDPSFPVTRGWVRADVNFDGVVNILDITTFGPHFGGTW